MANLIRWIVRFFPNKKREIAETERLRSIWTTSTWGMQRPLVPEPSALDAVEALAAMPGFTHIAEIGAGNCATAEALRQTFGDRFAVEASDIKNPRFEDARRRCPDLATRFEDAVTVSRRLKAHCTIYVAVNVLGNLPHHELEALIRNISTSRSALFFIARGLSTDDPDEFRHRAKVGIDYNFSTILSRLGMRFYSGTTTPRDAGGSIYQCTYVSTMFYPPAVHGSLNKAV